MYYIYDINKLKDNRSINCIMFVVFGGFIDIGYCLYINSQEYNILNEIDDDNDD